ncbi:MAG: DUF2892 domain-containing protein [Bacteroidota bacterium]|nr:DUF2892 domain-containing protein [Bacteroidota bacterium]
MTFEKNMGLADRIIRPTIAAGLVAAYATGKVKGTIGIASLALAAVFTVTSTFGSCPVYQALGVNTIIEDK